MTKPGRRVLVTGASSLIAERTCRLFAAEGASFFLVARNESRLESIAADLRVRGASHVSTFFMDLNDSERFAELAQKAFDTLGGVDLCLIAQGILGDQTLAERDLGEADSILKTNFSSTALLISALVPRFEAQKRGLFLVLSSVAGDRGRQSNYFYGAAKGGLNLFLAGLRNRLHGTGVGITTVKLGMVDTPMTAHLKRSPLFANPERVAKQLLKLSSGRKSSTYVPGFWIFVMWIIRSVPDFIFNRMKL